MQDIYFIQVNQPPKGGVLSHPTLYPSLAHIRPYSRIRLPLENSRFHFFNVYHMYVKMAFTYPAHPLKMLNFNLNAHGRICARLWYYGTTEVLNVISYTSH